MICHEGWCQCCGACCDVNTDYFTQSMLNMLVNDFLLVITELSHLLSAFSLSLTNLAPYFSDTRLHVPWLWTIIHSAWMLSTENSVSTSRGHGCALTCNHITHLASLITDHSSLIQCDQKSLEFQTSRHSPDPDESAKMVQNLSGFGHLGPNFGMSLL